MSIQTTPVESSQLAAIGHDPATNTLAVTFKSGGGGTYHYANVTAEDFSALKGAKSIGSHFIHNIKKNPVKYPYTKQAPAAK